MRKRGFSLVEVTLVVAIIAIITPVIYNVIDYQYKSYANIEMKATESRHERVFYYIMQDQVRFAKSVLFFDEVLSNSEMNKKTYDGYCFLWVQDGVIHISNQELKNKIFKNRTFSTLEIEYGMSDAHKFKNFEFEREDNKVLKYSYELGSEKISGAISMENGTELPEAPKPPKKILVIAYRPFYEELDWK